MRPSIPVACAVALLSAAPSAFAQEDDLLVPLTPDKPKSEPAEKPKSGGELDELIAPLEEPTELVVTLADPMILGARLFIDGKELGPVNGQPVEVGAGEHQLRVTRPGFSVFEAVVSVPPSGREHVVVSLFPESGVLNVQGSPGEADVYVDGTLVGKTPLREHLLKPGAREVRVAKEGFVAHLSQLTVRPGKDYTLSPTLARSDTPSRPAQLQPVAQAPSAEPSQAVAQAGGAALTPAAGAGVDPPWYGRWYVWAGAAAVALAGGTAAVVVTQRRSFTPEEVCGGACSDVINGKRTGYGLVLIAPKLSF